jgi:hypothetical protein
MIDVEGVYIKSHVYIPTHIPNKVNKENEPHIEVHLTIRAEEKEKPEEKLVCAMKQLASLVEANGGIALSSN